MTKITCLSTPPYIYIVYINAHIHQGFEPKNSGRCTKVLTTKSFQDFNIKEKKINLISLAWNCFKNSNFNILFFFQNLFKCYKWKHDLENYFIMYSKKLL
jgi:hypothetical protein